MSKNKLPPASRMAQRGCSHFTAPALILILFPFLFLVTRVPAGACSPQHPQQREPADSSRRSMLTTSDESELLLSIKQILDPSSSLSSWNKNDAVNYCAWQGVTCNNATRHVVELNITNISLRGSIPSFLCNLTHLGNISLSNTNLTGILPPELSLCENLDYLHLDHNQLTGALPKELGQLQKLRDIYVYNNKLTGGIPEEFGNCSRLTALNLQYNELSGPIPGSLGNCSELAWFKMTNNSLNGTLPDELGKLKKLQGMYLGDNELESSVPESFGGLESLSFLYLYGNRFSGALPDDVFTNLQALQYVDLTGNDFTGGIPTSLGECKKLALLHLTNNSFSGEIPRSLSNCTNLVYLDLKQNKLTGAIPGEIGRTQKNLSVVDFRENLLTGEVPFTFLNTSTLLYVDFSSNSLSGALPEPSNSREQTFLPLLRVLSLSNNSLTGPLPPWIWKLSAIQILDVAFNHFTGTIASNLSSLTALTKISNQSSLDGALQPHGGFQLSVKNGSYIYNLLTKSVTVVDLSNNSIEGHVPSDFGSLEALYSLSLANNLLTGTIPSRLSLMTQLESLNLAYNKLTGTIPPELGNLDQLNSLSLAWNDLSGEIPSTNGFNFKNEFSSFEGNPLLCGVPLDPCPSRGYAKTLFSDVVWSPGFGVGLVLGVAVVAMVVSLWQPARGFVLHNLKKERESRVQGFYYDTANHVNYEIAQRT